MGDIIQLHFFFFFFLFYLDPLLVAEAGPHVVRLGDHRLVGPQDNLRPVLLETTRRKTSERRIQTTKTASDVSA